MSSLLPRSGLWSFKQGLNNFLFGTIGNSVLHGNSQLLVALGSSQGTVDWHGRGWKRRDVARCSKLICLSVCFCTGTSLAKEHTRTSHNMKLWNVSSVTELILMLSGNRGEQHQSLSPWVLKLSSHTHNLCLSIQFVFHSTRLSQILFTTCRRSHAKDQSGNCSQLKDTFSMVEFVVCWLCRYASVSQRPAFKPGFRQYQRHALVQQPCSLHGTNPDRWWLGLAWSSSVSRAFDLKLLEQFANTVHWCCLNDERLTSPRLAYHLWIVDWFHLGSEYGKLYANFETRSPWKLSTTNCWVWSKKQDLDSQSVFIKVMSQTKSDPPNRWEVWNNDDFDLKVISGKHRWCVEMWHYWLTRQDILRHPLLIQRCHCTVWGLTAVAVKRFWEKAKMSGSVGCYYLVSLTGWPSTSIGIWKNRWCIAPHRIMRNDIQFAPKEDCRLPLAVTPVTTSCHSLLSTCLFLRRHSFLQIQNRTQQPIYASMNMCYTCIPLDTLHVNCRGRRHMDFTWSMHNDIYNTDTNVLFPFLSAVFSTQYVHFLERLNCCLGSICPSGLDMI